MVWCLLSLPYYTLHNHQSFIPTLLSDIRSSTHLLKEPAWLWCLQLKLLFFPGFPHAGFYSAFLLNGYYLEVYSYPKQIRFWCFRVWLNKLQHTNKSGSALASRDKPTVLCFAIPLFSWVWIHPTTLLWIPIPVYFPFTVPLSFSNAAWFGLVQGTIGRPPPYLGFFHKSGIWAKGSWCTNFL